MSQRHIHWDGLHNTRDLGGLPAGNKVTRFSQFYRAPRLDVLTGAGWRQLAEAGVRTLVDLRNADEIKELPIPAGVTRHHRPVEDQSVQEFMDAWAQHLNSPIYYSDVLTRWPQKIAEVFRCFVDAPAGGVLFHCGAGRDRTGMVGPVAAAGRRAQRAHSIGLLAQRGGHERLPRKRGASIGFNFFAAVEG